MLFINSSKRNIKECYVCLGEETAKHGAEGHVQYKKDTRWCQQAKSNIIEEEELLARRR